ncbi:unnamed protein product [Caenorhabditis angaria]|uniref:Major sperm protein n=1 Tax=Caenorhabditis angaria TaxID=860376 RepID=A0A9P1IQM9_9PELO|nr:unnamed protein product [Caenorhabditis angaria]
MFFVLVIFSMFSSQVICCGKISKPTAKKAPSKSPSAISPPKEEEEKKEEEKEEEEEEAEEKNDKPKEKKKKKEEKKEKTKEKKKEEKVDLKKKAVHIRIEEGAVLEFKAAGNEKKNVVVKNVHNKSVMFKVRSSNNKDYKVFPVYGTIDPGATLVFSVTHKQSAPKKDDKLIFMNTISSGDETDLFKSFKESEMTGKSVTVKVSAK